MQGKQIIMTRNKRMICDEGKMKSKNTKKIVKIIGNVLTILALGLVVYRLAHYNIDYSSVFTGRNVVVIIVLIVLFAIGLLFTPTSWANIIHFIGYGQVKFHDAQTICIRSNLMKYIPGNVMQYVGRNEIAVMYNLNHGKIAFSTILDIAANVIGVGIVSLICYRNGLATFFENFHISWKVVFPIGGLIMVIVIPTLFIFRKRIKEELRIIRWRRYIFSFFVYIIYGLFSGLLYILTMKYIVGAEMKGDLIITVIGAFLLSWLLGFITPGAPGGVGIREATIALFLNGFLQEEQILLGIVVYRVINTIGDVLAYCICLGWNKCMKNKNQEMNV